MNSNRMATIEAQKKKWERLKRRRLMLLAYHRVTMASIAREIGKSQFTVSTIVHLYPVKKSRHIQEYIAQRLNTSYEKLWGVDPHHNSQILSEKKRVVND